MSKGSNPTNVTTTTSAEPSEFIRPYLSTSNRLWSGFI